MQSNTNTNTNTNTLILYGDYRYQFIINSLFITEEFAIELRKKDAVSNMKYIRKFINEQRHIFQTYTDTLYKSTIHAFHNNIVSHINLESNTKESKVDCIQTFLLLILTPFTAGMMQKDMDFLNTVGRNFNRIYKWIDHNGYSTTQKNPEYYLPIFEQIKKDMKLVSKLVCDIKEYPEIRNSKICTCCYKIDKRPILAIKSTRNNGIPHQYSGCKLFVRNYNGKSKIPTYELYWNDYCSKCQETAKSQL